MGAAGRVPGNYFRREARASEDEILTSRLIDRSIRPLFPKGFRSETQVVATVLSYDPETSPGVLSILGASAALMLSEIPWEGPVAGVRLARTGKDWVALPTPGQLGNADADLVVTLAGGGGLVMAEGEAREVPESDLLRGLAFAGETLAPVLELFTALATEAEKPLVGRAVARRVDPVPDPAHDASAPVGRVIVVGGGRVGRLVSDMLRVHDKPYVSIESDADLVLQDKRDGYNVIFGNAARLETLQALRVEDASAIVLTMDAPVLAQRLVSRLRKAYPNLLIVSRARDAAHAAALYQAGASHAVPETLESSLQLSEAVLVDIGVAMGPVIASIHDKRDQFRSQIEKEGALTYRPKLRSSTADG